MFTRVAKTNHASMAKHSFGWHVKYPKQRTKTYMPYFLSEHLIRCQFELAGPRMNNMKTSGGYDVALVTVNT